MAAAREWGLLAEFDSPHSLAHACERVRDAGYSRWDAHSPFPVHGMEEMIGMRPSRVSFFVGTGALLGVGGAWLLQYWTSAVDYEMVTAGKPFGAWEPFTPIMFELGVLLASFGAILGMLLLNGLPRWHHPLLKIDRFLSSTDDAFFISIESADSKFDPQNTRRLLEEAGAISVQSVQP